MAIANFIPELWSTKILREKDKVHKLIKNCNRGWDGKIESIGSKVKINSINYPTIRTFDPDADNTRENPKDEQRVLEITEQKYFDVKLDDVSKKQANKGAMEEVIRKGAIALVDTQEQFISALYVDAGKAITDTSVTSADIYSKITKARRILHTNNVTDSMEVVLEVGPTVWEKIVLAGIVNTDSVDPMKGAYEGYWSKLLGMRIFVSNNIQNTVTDDDVVLEHCMMRTKESIAFAEQIMKTEKYRIEKGFGDGVKALTLYGAKVIKPKELVALNLTTAAETTI